MTNPQDNLRMYQANCPACGKLWQPGDVATEVVGDGRWRHHDCNDPQLEIAVPAPW